MVFVHWYFFTKVSSSVEVHKVTLIYNLLWNPNILEAK